MCLYFGYATVSTLYIMYKDMFIVKNKNILIASRTLSVRFYPDDHGEDIKSIKFEYHHWVIDN